MVCAHKENGDAVDYLRRVPNANRRQLVRDVHRLQPVAFLLTCSQLYEAALGLAYLHSKGVVHGDIKAVSLCD